MAEITIAEALKKFAVALGFGSNVNEYSGNDIENLLYQIAVKMQCASQVADVRAQGIAGLLNYIAENYDSEEKEPYDLAVTTAHTTVTVKRGNKTLTPAADILYNGDKIKITAVADEGYELGLITVNGAGIESGDTVTVSGHNIAIVATSTATPT